MKKLTLILLCASFIGCFYNSGSGGDDLLMLSRYTPLTMPISEFENSIAIENATEVTESSKIYIINSYIFVNDKRRGFHIFDNTNPSNPVKKKFLKIPGATDIAIRNNTLYINQATDLVALTFDFNNFIIKIDKRVKNVFPEIQSPDGEIYHKDGEVVVNWIKK